MRREDRVQILQFHIVTLTRQRVVEVADPYKIRGNRIVRISRADDIRLYKIVLICNIDCLPIADIYNYKLLLCFARSFITRSVSLRGIHKILLANFSTKPHGDMICSEK